MLTLPRRFTGGQCFSDRPLTQIWTNVTDADLGRGVVVKVWKQPFRTPAEMERFSREVTTHRVLSSHDSPIPTIVAFEAASTPDADLPWIATTPGGETLTEVMKRSNFTLETAVRFSSEILDALAQIHAKGIVHGDVKPDNVVVLNGRAAVCDLGLADFADAPQPQTQLGTPKYAAPELVSHSEQGGRHSFRTDVYSAGVLISELLQCTGESPKHLNQLVIEAKSVRPEDRPIDAQDFKRQFRDACKKDQLLEAGEVLVEGTGVTRRRVPNAAIMAGAFIVAAVILVGLIVALQSTGHTSTPMTATPTDVLAPYCVAQDVCIPPDADDARIRELLSQVPGADSAPAGGGPWEFAVLHTRQEGLFVRNGYTEKAVTLTDKNRPGGKAFIDEGHTVLVDCQVASGWQPVAGAGRTWYKIRFPEPSNAGQYWVYAKYAYPVGHNGAVPTCAASEMSSPPS
ncbi:MAG: serine/threonine-protein kinase [Actinomycetales bacterium]